MTQLIFFNKEINWNKLFDFGGHEKLKILILNNASFVDEYHYCHWRISDISEGYPNLEILSVRRNYINDLRTSLDETPLPKLKILDLSGNKIKSTRFVKLLPNSLHFLDFHDNLLSSLVFNRKQVNLLALNLDNNNLKYRKKYNNSRDHSYNLYNRRYRYNIYLYMYDQSGQDIYLHSLVIRGGFI